KEKQLEALTKDHEARDRRMAELTEQLRRKSAAIDSLEKAVENAHYEIRLLKIGEQEKDRKIAALDEKIQELEELLEIGNRGMVREIDELTKAVADEQANVKVLEDLVEAHHQHMAAMAQKTQNMMTLQEKMVDEQSRDQADHAAAPMFAEVSDKSKPRSVGEEKKTNVNETQSMRAVQLGGEAVAEGPYEEEVEYLCNAIGIYAQPQLLHGASTIRAAGASCANPSCGDWPEP
ncbi:hypothetical protein AAVH_33862, partial [Aphelenchoides avenae]